MPGEPHVPWMKTLRHSTRDEVVAVLTDALTPPFTRADAATITLAPIERVRFAITLVPGAEDGRVWLDATIPAPSGASGHARRVLAAHGWTAPTGPGTRSYRRRLTTPDEAMSVVLEAYSLVHGSVGDDRGWMIEDRGWFLEPPVGTAFAPVPTARWTLDDDDGRPHEVAVDAPTFRRSIPYTARVDGVEVQLPGRFWYRMRAVSFVVAGRPANLRLRLMTLGIRGNFRRSLKAAISSKWGLAVLLVPPVFAGLVAARATDTLLLWAIYSLVVDGSDRGSWVYRFQGGSVDSLTWVEPGGALPDGKDASWGEP